MRTSCLILFCFIGLSALAQRTDTIPVLPQHYLDRVAKFKKEPIVKEKIIFLGNGFMEAGKWRRMLKDSSVINRGIKGDITSSLLLRVGDVISRQPSTVFILIGEDDFFKKIPDENIIENIFSIITRIKKGSKATKIYVESILPVNPTIKNFPAGYDHNDRAVTINDQLKKYADRLGYTYLDLYSEFADGKGHLQTAYGIDGVSLSAAGYTHLFEILKKKNCF